MAVDVERLLAPVSEDSPAGPDLAYDSSRYEIEQAFESSVSVDVSGAEAAGQEVDWRQIVRLIEQESAKTKDLWLAVYLCRAGARAGSIETLLTGAKYLQGLLDRYWECVHPQLDEYGFQGRKGPCDSLTRTGEFLRPLQGAILLEHPRLGRFSAADFIRFQQNAEAEEGYGQFRAALNDTPEETLLQTAEALNEITASIREADRVLTTNAEGDTAPNFRPTYEALGQIRQAVLAFTSTPAAQPAAEGAAEPPSGVASQPAAGPRIAGRVDSREDVIRAIDAIADYYRRQEPGSPVPLLIQRAREWVPLDFLSILEDMLPSSVDDAKRVLTMRKSEDDSDR